MIISFFNRILKFFIFLAVGVSAMGGYSFYVLKSPLQPSAPEMYVPKGAGYVEIAQVLEQSGAMPSLPLAKWVFMGVSKGKRMPLRAGEYTLSPTTNLWEIMEKVAKGEMIVRKVTVPEGYTVAEIYQVLEKNPYLKGSVTRISGEGSLAPDTYIFTRDDLKDKIVDQMFRLQQTYLKTLWEKRSPHLPFKTPYEALILASIVEKETGVAAERPRVAAVFINRLRKGMRLQSDPTVIYGITLGKGPLGRSITKTDLTTPTPYNTYTIDALPPTPIANPGKAALEAVFNPMDTEELYFVANGDGGHTFASTLAEHNENVRRWRQLQVQKEVQPAEETPSPLVREGDGR